MPTNKDKPRIKTVGQMYEYTMDKRWKRLASAKTNYYNSMHVLGFCGRGELIKNMAHGYWWIALKEHTIEQNPKMSKNTINKVLSAASTMLNFTRKAGLHNVHAPDLDIKEKYEPANVLWLRQEEVEKAARVAKDFFEEPMLAKAILFSSYTMLRQGELLRLRAKDIDLQMGYIRVGGDPKAGLVNKGREAGRTTAIHSRIREICEDLVRTAQSNDEKVFGKWFTNTKGVPEGEVLYRKWEKVRRKCGFDKGYDWHSLRATGATWYGRTMKPRELMAVGGWKTLSVMLKYCDVDNQSAMQAQASLAVPSAVPAADKPLISEPTVLPDGSIYLNGQVFRPA